MIKDKIVREIEDILQLELPYSYIDGYFQINGQTTSATLSNIGLFDSKYNFDYPNKRILHFTNLDAAKKILTSRYLRASNFNQFKDKLELSYALSLISVDNQKEWDNWKNEQFALSFTEKTIEDVKGNYKYHWGNYANNNRGVALEFEITRIPLSPNYYALKNVYIENEKFDTLLTFAKSQKLDDVTVKFLIPILSIFKRVEFVEEDEVRLLYSSSLEDFESSIFGDLDLNLEYSVDKENHTYFNLNVPFFTPNQESDSSFLMKLHSIHISTSTHINSGSLILNNFFVPYCKENQIKIYW